MEKEIDDELWKTVNFKALYKVLRSYDPGLQYL